MPPRAKFSPKIFASKGVVTDWLKEIVGEMQADDPIRFSNVAIGRHAGYDEKVIRQYLTGEKQVHVHTILRMPWPIARRLLRRIEDHFDRGAA